MACSEENGKNDLDNATDDATASSQPPPLYLSQLPNPLPLPSSHFYPCPPPNYPSGPPPEYSTVVGMKMHEASKAARPYLYTTSEANQPQPMFLPSNVQARDVRSQQQVVYIERNTLRGHDHHLGQPSFLGLIFLSCCVFWFFGGWICGGLAFFVALIAQSSASSGDVAGARRLGHLSLCLSICGLIFGVIITVAIIEGAAVRK
jgi:hypothetical protein